MSGYWKPEDVGATFNESTGEWEFPIEPPTPVAYQSSPTVETLRDALVTLGMMEPAP